MEKTRRNSRLRIIAAAALFICAAATAVILNSVYNMEPSPFDLWLQKAFFSIRGPILNVVVTIITHCGDNYSLLHCTSAASQQAHVWSSHLTFCLRRAGYLQAYETPLFKSSA